MVPVAIRITFLKSLQYEYFKMIFVQKSVDKQLPEPWFCSRPVPTTQTVQFTVGLLFFPIRILILRYAFGCLAKKICIAIPYQNVNYVRGLFVDKGPATLV